MFKACAERVAEWGSTSAKMSLEQFCSAALDRSELSSVIQVQWSKFVSIILELRERSPDVDIANMSFEVFEDTNSIDAFMRLRANIVIEVVRSCSFNSVSSKPSGSSLGELRRTA